MRPRPKKNLKKNCKKQPYPKEQKWEEKRDPIESNPRCQPILKVADDYIQEKYRYALKDMGFCHIYCGDKKAFLWDRFGIEWKCPSEMNPDMLCD